VDLTRIRTGRLGESDWPRLAASCQRISQTGIGINDRAGLSITEIRGLSRQFAGSSGVGLIVVDYVQLVSGDGQNREQEVSSVGRGLKIMSRELNCPVVALAQLNRGVESRDDKVPRLSDLRESGALEQDSDAVLMIYRDDYYNENSEEPGVARIKIAKNRHGPTGSVRLGWVPEQTRFCNITKG
jgi:replicative DNA helicase